MRKPCLQTVVVVLLFLHYAHASNLYAVVTEYAGGDSLETRVFTVLIDRNTGAVTNIVENLIYAGGSATLDEVSAFDQNKGRYFFSTDFRDTYIHASDVKNKVLLAPTDISALDVFHLVYDDATDLLYTLFISASDNLMYLASISGASVNIVLAVPQKYNVQYIMKGCVDGSTKTYYLAGKTGAVQEPTYTIATIDLNTGSIIKEVAVDNKTCTVFPEYIWFDQTSGNILSGAQQFENSQWYYYFMIINPTTGACHKTPLKAPIGQATAWTYDPTTKELIFSEDTDDVPYLISYNIQTGTQSAPVPIDQGFSPTSLEISLLNY